MGLDPRTSRARWCPTCRKWRLAAFFAEVHQVEAGSRVGSGMKVELALVALCPGCGENLVDAGEVQVTVVGSRSFGKSDVDGSGKTRHAGAGTEKG